MKILPYYASNQPLRKIMIVLTSGAVYLCFISTYYRSFIMGNANTLSFKKEFFVCLEYSN